MKIFSVKNVVLVSALSLSITTSINAEDIKPYGVVPTAAHMEYQSHEIMGLIHWGPNTYADREWGFGNTSPSLVKPTKLNPEQWVISMKAAGIEKIVLICKHHDGFCLWPSKYNKDYSVSAIPEPFKGFDIVKATRDACLKHGLQFGTYLSPWDRHQGIYGTPKYVEYYHNQWDELLENYGPISEIWLDGANGGTGWYGGVNGDEGERRTIPANYYDFPRLLTKMHKKYPLAIAFGGDGDFSSMWCGNESGYMPDGWRNVRKGPRDGKEYWMPSEADTPLRDGWFYHPHEKPRTLKALVNCYFDSVGRGGILNFGIAPDREGLVCADDVVRLKEFGDYVRAYNKVDFSKDAKSRVEKFTDNGGEMVVELPKAISFNAVDFRERVEFGQRIKSFMVEVRKDGKWCEVGKGSTVGLRRIIRFNEVTSDAVRITLVSYAKPVMHPVAIRFAPAVKESTEKRPQLHSKDKWKVLSSEKGLVVDCGKVVAINGFDYIPNLEGCNHGIVDAYTFEVSTDGNTWTKASSGEFGNLAANPMRTRIAFEKPMNIKYFRFTANHRLTKGDGYCTKEIDLFEAK